MTLFVPGGTPRSAVHHAEVRERPAAVVVVVVLLDGRTADRHLTAKEAGLATQMGGAVAPALEADNNCLYLHPVRHLPHPLFTTLIVIVLCIPSDGFFNK